MTQAAQDASGNETALPTLPAFIAQHLTFPRPVALAELRGGQTLALSALNVTAAPPPSRTRCGSTGSAAATGSRSSRTTRSPG